MSYHSTLQRQIDKYLGPNFVVTPELAALLDVISKTYIGHDEDRKLIERSLDFSSKELTEANLKMQNALNESKKQAEESERMNKLMIGRELKMIDLKKEIDELKRKAA